MTAPLPLAFRLALRRLRTEKLSTALSALALSIPAAALLVVHTATLNPANGISGDEAAAGVMVALISPLFIALGAIAGSMVAAAALARSRGHERMLVLLETIGASRGLRFRVASASGILTGLLAAAIAIVIGIPVSLLYVILVVRPESAPTLSGTAVVLTAVVALVVSWVSSIALLVRSRSRSLVAELRDVPTPALRPLTSGLTRGRTGRITIVAGVGLAMVSSGFQLARFTIDLSSDWSIVIALGLQAALPAGVLIAVGAILQAPAFFALVGRRTRSTSVRLAARDAVLSSGRAIAAVSAVLLITLTIGSYSTLFRATSAIDEQTYPWSFQLGQVAIDTIDQGWRGEDTPIDPQPSDRAADAKAALDSYLGVESRELDAVKGPFYGSPVDDYEGYPGRLEMVFPTDGLPTPRVDDDACEARELADWRCAPSQLAFELDSIRRSIWVGDAADLAAILGATPDAGLIDALDRGDALVFDARYLSENDTVSLDWFGPDQFTPENEPGEFLPAGAPLRTETLQGTLIPLEHALDYGLFVSDATAEQLGLVAEPSRLIASTDRLLSTDEFTALDSAIMAATSTSPDDTGMLYPRVEVGPNRLDAVWPIGAIVLGFGASLAIAVAAVGLVRFEGRRSTRTLRALGAVADIGSRVSAWYALIVIGYASVIGTGVAILLTATLWRQGVNPFWPGPLLELGVLGLGVPLLAALIALLWRREGR